MCSFESMMPDHFFSTGSTIAYHTSLESLASLDHKSFWIFKNDPKIKKLWGFLIRGVVNSRVHFFAFFTKKVAPRYLIVIWCWNIDICILRWSPDSLLQEAFWINLKLVYLMELQGFKVARVSQIFHTFHDLHDNTGLYGYHHSHFAIAFLT